MAALHFFETITNFRSCLVILFDLKMIDGTFNLFHTLNHTRSTIFFRSIFHRCFVQCRDRIQKCLFRGTQSCCTVDGDNSICAYELNQSIRRKSTELSNENLQLFTDLLTKTKKKFFLSLNKYTERKMYVQLCLTHKFPSNYVLCP